MARTSHASQTPLLSQVPLTGSGVRGDGDSVTPVPSSTPPTPGSLPTPGSAQGPHAQRAASPVGVAPRLLSLRQGAVYLGLSFWSLRDYVLAGLVPVVEMPPLRPREGERARSTLRRTLVDREDLDRFIDARKSGIAQDIQSCAHRNQPVNIGPNRAAVPDVCPESSNAIKPNDLPRAGARLRRERRRP